jgi:hypothetical protein
LEEPAVRILGHDAQCGTIPAMKSVMGGDGVEMREW